MKQKKLFTIIGVLALVFLAVIGAAWYTQRTLFRQRKGLPANSFEKAFLHFTKAGEYTRALLQDPATLDTKRPTLKKRSTFSVKPEELLGEKAIPINAQLLYSSYDYKNDQFCWQLLDLK